MSSNGNPYINILFCPFITFPSSLIFGNYYSILDNRCQPPNCSLLDLCSWLFFVFGRNSGHLVCHVPFLEEVALSKNRCSCQSLRCHSGNRRAHHCHGDCRNRKPGWFCKASNHYLALPCLLKRLEINLFLD